MSPELKKFIDLCRNKFSENDAIALWKTSNASKTPKDLNDDINAIKSAKLDSTSTYTPTSLGDKNKPVEPIDFGVLLKNIAGAQQNQYGMPGLSEELLQINDIYNLIFDSQDKLMSPKDIMTTAINKSVESLVLYYRQQSSLLTTINEKAGMTGKYSEAFREELSKANPVLLQIGIGFNDLADAAEKSITQSGRFATNNAETWTRAGVVAKAYVGTLSDLVGMYPEFEKIGVGAADAQERIGAAGRAALGLGLQAQKTTKDLSTNLSKLNEYGFKNGIDGLASMVRKATEFRMSMDEVFKIAEKVMSPEGAIELSANLQVLGGAIGDFGDPLKLMYMATNDVEGLQDALIGAAGGLAVYNEEQGRFELSGINLRKAKAMADSLGVSYQEFSKGAISAAERAEAASSLLARGLTLSDDQKRFITNISQMKGGKMTIELNSEKLQNEFGAKEVALESLTQDQLAKLTEFQEEFIKKTDEDIVRQQATDIENMTRDISSIKAIATQQLGVFMSDIAKKTIRTATGGKTERLSDITSGYAKDANNKLSGAGLAYSNEMTQKLAEITGQVKKKETKTPIPKEKTKTTGSPIVNLPEDKTQRGDMPTSFVMPFNNEAISNLANLNTKQDGLITNTFNIATNTANTGINVQNLSNQLISYFNMLNTQNKGAIAMDPTSAISNLTTAYTQFGNKQDALLNQNLDIALNTFNTTKALEIINNQFNVISKLGQPKINVESEVNSKNLLTKDNLVNFASNIKPMGIRENVIEKPKQTETETKNVSESTHTVKISLAANDASVDKVSRAVSEMLLSSPELSGKLVDKLSYLSVGQA